MRGLKRSEKIDLAVAIDGEVRMLIECKGANVKLNSSHLNQLFRYYSVSDVGIAVLTNGVVYRFYADLDSPGRMDSEAFLEVDLRNLSGRDVEALGLFRRESFCDDAIMEYAGELKYRMKIRQVVADEIEFADEDTVRLIAKRVYGGVLTKARFEFFEKLVREEIKNVFESGFVRDEEVITTDEEMEGFYIVRAVLSEVVDASRIFIRDHKSYCSVIFDNNRNYTICRFYFDDLDNLMVSLFDSMQKDKNGSRIEEKVTIDRVSDIYRYRDRLVETVRVYERVKK